MRQRAIIEEPEEPLDETRRRRRVIRERRIEESLGAEAIPPTPPILTPTPTPAPATAAAAERTFTFSSTDVPFLADKKAGDMVTFEVTAEVTNVKDNVYTLRLIEAKPKAVTQTARRAETRPAEAEEEEETPASTVELLTRALRET